MWEEAIDRESNALIVRGTQKYISQTLEMDSIPITWTFRIKDASTATGTLYKARRCLYGNHQKAIRHFDPSALDALVAKHGIIRMFLKKVAAKRLKREDVDIDNAYLYGQLDKPIIMKKPYDSSGKVRHPGHACLVVKSLYSARQAGKIWGTHLPEKLLE